MSSNERDRGAADWRELPVMSCLPELEQALAQHRSAVLSAPTGSGKTTALPLALLDSPWLRGQRIVMLEPRRIAARAAARRMAELLGEPAGGTVGYQVRHERRIGAATRIEVVTEGILTRRLQQDPGLEGVGLVIFDEFHERSIHSDLALALCLDARGALCEDLRLLVMSATLAANDVAALLDDAPQVTAGGRSYPVQMHFSQNPVDPERASSVTTAVHRALREQGADVLVFLPGIAAIRRVERELAGPPGDRAPAAPLQICPLYGDLPPAQQDRALRPDPAAGRRVVLATNIAETSLTIEGIGAVVDSGLARRPEFDARSGLSRLLTVPISRASAEQRAGRAGRLGPGVCWRLWTEAEHRQRAAHDVPEIALADLASLALELAAWGVRDAGELRWLTPPPAGALGQARSLLRALGALTAGGAITALGTKMVDLGVQPRLAGILLGAQSAREQAAASDLAALIDSPDILVRGHDAGADLGYRLERFQNWRAGHRAAELNDRACRAVEQTSRALRRRLKVPDLEPAGQPREEAGRLLLGGYADRVARRRPGSASQYRLANGRGAQLPASDALGDSEFLVVPDLDAGSSTGRIYLAAATALDDLAACLADRMESRRRVEWNPREQQVVAARSLMLGDLEVRREALTEATGDELDRAMAEGVRQLGLSCLVWPDATMSLRVRVQCLREWLPEESWPALDDETLLATLEQWLVPFFSGARRLSHLQRVDVAAAIDALLPYALRQRINELAPGHLEIPSGRKVSLTYEAGAAPVLAAKLQEFFGFEDTPRICAGRVPVQVHLLSPAGRPLQVTQDLKGFWRNVYPQVRKEMRGRYPKHPWPEDPLSAEATRLTKRALNSAGGRPAD